VGIIVPLEGGDSGFKVKSYYGDNEAELLSNFASMVNGFSTRKSNLSLCAHNGKEFDFPYIARRMLINGLKIPDILNVAGKKPWEVKFIDTMELWKFGDIKHYTSLNLLA
jgi:DNA polymerase elongation subunit (family B)